MHLYFVAVLIAKVAGPLLSRVTWALLKLLVIADVGLMKYSDKTKYACDSAIKCSIGESLVFADKRQRLVERWQRCLVDNKTRWQERAVSGQLSSMRLNSWLMGCAHVQQSTAKLQQNDWRRSPSYSVDNEFISV